MTIPEIFSVLDAERKRQGMSLERLMERTEIKHESTWHRFREGTEVPNLSTLIAYCKALGMEMRFSKGGDALRTTNRALLELDNARELQNLTDSQLCRKAGHSSTCMYSRWMDGGSIPRLATLMDFLDALGLEIRITKGETA